MGKRKNRKPSKRVLLWDKISGFMEGLDSLSDALRDRETTDAEVEICKRASEFIGSLCGRAALFSTLDDEEKDILLTMLSNMETFMIIAMLPPSDVPVGLGEKTIAGMTKEIEQLYTPDVVPQFLELLEKARTDRISAMACLLELCVAVNERFYQSRSGEDFCDVCGANKIADEVRPDIEELLLPKVKSRSMASTLESFAKHSGVPKERTQTLLKLANNFRDLSNISDDADDIENWDEILDAAAMTYGCAKMELSALVNRGVLEASAVARAFNTATEEIEKFSKSDDVVEYCNAFYG